MEIAILESFKTIRSMEEALILGQINPNSLAILLTDKSMEKERLSTPLASPAKGTGTKEWIKTLSTIYPKLYNNLFIF